MEKVSILKKAASTAESKVAPITSHLNNPSSPLQHTTVEEKHAVHYAVVKSTNDVFPAEMWDTSRC